MINDFIKDAFYYVNFEGDRLLGFRFSPNTGRLLENAVFLALRRGIRDIYYYRTQEGLEVDFYLPGEGRLVQVAQSLDQPELRAIEAALGAGGIGADLGGGGE
jgi:predicted AAA+ superfamily ATPase